MRHSASVHVKKKQVSAARSCYPNLKLGNCREQELAYQLVVEYTKYTILLASCGLHTKHKIYWQMEEYEEPYSDFTCKWLSTDNWTHTFVVRWKSTDNMTHTFVVKWRSTENMTHIHLLLGGGVQSTGHTSVVRWRNTEIMTHIHLLSGGRVQRTGHTYICCQVEEYRDHNTRTFVVRWRSTENTTHIHLL